LPPVSLRQRKPGTTLENIGDYVAGGFFWKDNTLNYVTHWVESDDIHANLVRLPYRPPSNGDPSMTITAAWRRDAADEVQMYD
jgi:hypothetical protein